MTDETIGNEDAGLVPVVTLPAELAEYIEGALASVDADPAEVRSEIMERIASAQSPEELLSGDGVLGGSDLLGVPQEVLDIKWQRSSFEGGSGVFGVVTAARLDTGEKVLWTSGADKVMGKLLVAAARGWLPIRGRIVRSDRPSASGYYPQDFVALEAGETF